MNDLSIANVEETLMTIKQHELNIDAAQKFRDEQIDYFQSLIDEAKADFERDTASDKEQIAILTQHLKSYFDANPPTGRKTLKFAAGSFGYSKTSTKFFFRGEEARADNKELLAACEKTSDGKNFVKTKKYLDWAALKKNLSYSNPQQVCLEDTGEVIEGLIAYPGFVVKTSKR